jgi:hypothetical protein
MRLGSLSFLLALRYSAEKIDIVTGRHEATASESQPAEM